MELLHLVDVRALAVRALDLKLLSVEFDAWSNRPRKAVGKELFA
jgi:hypothetical protein